MLKKLVIAAFVVMNYSAQAWAQDEGPGRGVARISVINGDVSVRRGDSEDVIAAAVNSPLVVQDRLLTGPTSRAEVQFDWANMIRLASDAEVRFAELEYKRYIVQVARGTATFRVLRDQDADVEVSTPSVSVRPVKRGTYRISVHEDGTSEITVRSGEAEIYTPKGSERLKSGRTMIARGTTAEPEFRVVSEIQEDDWDHWNQRRDKDLERSRSYQYVSRDIYGADDLDDHGRWVHVSQYGWVWSPRVAVGWAPYRYGRWSWIDYYGWSWVSYDPWGWAPYHYGRWFYSAPVGWCWWPGTFGARHYWSPGLVAFFGFGSGRVGLGFGNVGWVPLAPYERYYPWYGRGYYGSYRGGGAYPHNNVRIVNNVNITNVYRNSRIDHAVTVVDQDGFGRGRPGSAFRGRDGDFSRASLVQGQLPVTPGRESLRLADRDAAIRPTGEREGGRFFSRRQPAAVERVPFEDQRRGLEQATRRTFAGASGGSIPDATGTSMPGLRQGVENSIRPSDRSFERGQDNGWRRFGAPRTEAQGESIRRNDQAGQFGNPERSGDAEMRGWRRVGEASSRNAEIAPRERVGDSSGERGSDWRRFGSQRDAASFDSGTPATASPRGADGWRRDIGPRGDALRSDPAGRGARESQRLERRSDSFGGGDPVRISPPIVRERGSFDRGWSGRGSSGGQSQAAPRTDFGGMRGMDGGMRGGAGRAAGGARGSEGGGARGGGGGGQAGGGGRSSGGGGRGR